MSVQVTVSPRLSGSRFGAVYELRCAAADAEQFAREIALEQTVEFPGAALPPGPIADEIVGRIESLEPIEAGRYRVAISYADELLGGELTQAVNVLFGNVAMYAGVRLVDIQPSPGLLAAGTPPRYGLDGIRRLLGAPHRPLLATAIKPVGLCSADLARLAATYASHGIDLVKDDHGLCNQPFSHFRERVERCVEAVSRAAAASGRVALYAANVTTSADRLVEAARWACRAGVGALMIAPGLAGLDAVRQLAADPQVDRPILAHPSLLGHLCGDPRRGIGHRALFGQLMRLAGADASIFPTHGGRFPDTLADSREVLEGCRAPLGPLLSILPMAGGGISLARVPEIVAAYGADTCLLIGGGLHTAGPDVGANCEAFRTAVERS